jgi:hypothetical protein
MSFCRRDIARELLSLLNKEELDDNLFVNCVAKFLAQNKLNNKTAEKMIVRYYQAKEKLLSDLRKSVNEDMWF